MTGTIEAPTPSAPDDDASVAVRAPVGRWRRFRSWVRRRPATALALGWLVLLVLGMLLAEVVSRHDPATQDVLNMLDGPSAEHWLGTDDLGRDVFARLLSGARVSMLAAVLAVVVAVGIGTPIGIVTGYLGGKVDDIMMRVVDTMLSFPAIILAIAVTAALGPGLNNAMIAIGIVLSPVFARLMRGQVLAVKEELYVDAARSFGARGYQIVLSHIVPNAIQPIIVQASLSFAVALIAEASLSFLGLGVQPPQSSWGFMLGRAYRDMHKAPFQMVVPGMAIMLTVLSFNLLGDALRVWLDPTSRGRNR
ncbi:MAG: ABC transporter permease [Desertimonas sp.]